MYCPLYIKVNLKNIKHLHFCGCERKRNNIQKLHVGVLVFFALLHLFVLEWIFTVGTLLQLAWLFDLNVITLGIFFARKV